jgi:PAS domain S-box-containing protein
VVGLSSGDRDPKSQRAGTAVEAGSAPPGDHAPPREHPLEARVRELETTLAVLAVRAAAERTDYAARERVLAESEERFRTLAENSPDLVVRFDRDLRVLYANTAVLRRMLKVRGDLAGRTAGEIGVSPAVVDAWEQVARRALTTGERQRFEITTHWAGDTRSYDAVVAPELGKDGSIASLLAIGRDITEREQAQAALRAANAELAAADRRRSELVAMMSHELRNPLAAMRSAVFVLARAAPDAPQAARARDVVDRQTRKLARLVDDLLDTTRLAHGKLRVERAPIDLAALVRQVALDHRDLFERAGIAFEARVEDAPLVVSGDATRLEQLLGNLLQNALKFTPEGGAVVVALAQDGATGEAVLRVRDTGVGIAKEMLPRLFEPFAQADATLDRSRGGLGLGLALVEAIAERHGGSVVASSDGPGTGAELVVRLPTA